MSTRKIKDAKDLTSGEKIYFKGHARATFMSDGSNVEDYILSMGANNVGGGDIPEDIMGIINSLYSANFSGDFNEDFTI